MFTLFMRGYGWLAGAITREVDRASDAYADGWSRGFGGTRIEPEGLDLPEVAEPLKSPLVEAAAAASAAADRVVDAALPRVTIMVPATTVDSLIVKAKQVEHGHGTAARELAEQVLDTFGHGAIKAPAASKPDGRCSTHGIPRADCYSCRTADAKIAEHVGSVEAARAGGSDRLKEARRIREAVLAAVNEDQVRELFAEARAGGLLDVVPCYGSLNLLHIISNRYNRVAGKDFDL